MATDVRTTAFTRVIKEQLFAGNEFLLKSVSHDAFVNNLTVEIPISGTLPDIVEDRTSYPIAVQERTDTKQTYDLIEFSLGVVKLSEKEKKELSYDKASSILRQHMLSLKNRIALRGLYNWAGTGLVSASGQIILTTGTTTANIAPPGGTGNRNSLSLDDMSYAALKLDEDEMPMEGRYMAMPARVYRDFVNQNKAYLLNQDYNKNLSNGDISDGVVSKVMGFKIIPRSYTIAYADAATPTKKAVGAATATTDRYGIVGWQMDEVARALGSTKVYRDVDSATYQGDLYSATQRFNNTQMRTDGAGIVTIVQDS